MQNLLDDDTSRRTVIVAAVTAVIAVVLTSGDRFVRWGRRVQGADALPYIETACGHLQDNYEMMHEAGLTSPLDLSQLDPQTFDQNLVDATAAKTQADEHSGISGFNQDVTRALTELNHYIETQNFSTTRS